MNWLESEYVPVAASTELRKKPIRRMVLDQPVLLARTQSGVAFALHDLCPHRGAPLSEGRRVGDGIECPYHGIVFDRDGRAVALPWSEEPCRLRAKRFGVLEQEGMLFATSDPDAPLPPKLAAPKGWRSLTLTSRMEVPAREVVENFMDSAHTGIVHKGLIRSSRRRRPRSVLVTSDDRTVTAEHEAQDEDLGIARRWLGKGAISHRDTCHLPGIVEVEYAVNGATFFRALIFVAPRTKGSSQTSVRAAFSSPRSGSRVPDLLRGLTDRAAALVAPAIGRRVLRQDRDLLEATEASVERSGARTLSSVARRKRDHFGAPSAQEH